MFTNDQQNDAPTLNRGSANKMNTNPAAGPPGAASQPGEPGAAAPLHAMSTPIQPYGADTVIYEKSDNFVQTSAGADVFMPPVNDTFSVPGRLFLPELWHRAKYWQSRTQQTMDLHTYLRNFPDAQGRFGEYGVLYDLIKYPDS